MRQGGYACPDHKINYTMKKILLSALMICACTAMFAQMPTAAIQIVLSSDLNFSDQELTLMESTAFTEGIEPGYDQQKSMSITNPSQNVKLYALVDFTEYDKAGMLATNNLDGTKLGFLTNTDETEYKLTFTNVMGTAYNLIDKYLGTTTLIVANGEYPFTAPTGTQIDNRFEIRALAEVPGMTITAHEDPEVPGDFYSTFYHGARDFKLPAGTEAYVAQVSTENLELTNVANGGDVIPHGVAFILKSNAATINLANADAAAVAISVQNDLRGLDYEADAPAPCYIFSGHSTDNSVTGIGFYLYEGTKLAANKAYVTLSGSNAPKRLRFVFAGEQEATGVENVQVEAKAEKFIENGQIFIRRGNEVFNLQGQVVK